MIVQWGIKGLMLPDDDAALQIIDRRQGLVSNWMRNEKDGLIRVSDIPGKLTPENLDLHVNHFDEPDPVTGRPVAEVTPFISIACGVVSRVEASKTNDVISAFGIAQKFATDSATLPFGYLYWCWVLVSPRPAVEIESVAEEVRDLNSYRSYSKFQPEGEVVAKVVVPSNQIHRCEKWTWSRRDKMYKREWKHLNPAFVEPERLSNVREVI
ncbi:hypothetical protein AB0K00_04170 [Dactylosporangium sp. NPDC049525]|uniref:hypothetical protein n=1 Tax=Dactylosporangium sp. NPDC049525 TaxID=3154730 RepID=UPI0034187C48